jgi:TonB family protein
LSGTVVLEFDVDERGVVADVVVKESARHGFDEAAVAAVEQLVFAPALKNGTPVSAHVTYAYKLVLESAPKSAATATGAASAASAASMAAKCCCANRCRNGFSDGSAIR